MGRDRSSPRRRNGGVKSKLESNDEIGARAARRCVWASEAHEARGLSVLSGLLRADEPSVLPVRQTAESVDQSAILIPISQRSIRVKSGRARAGSRCWRDRRADICVDARRGVHGRSRQCWGNRRCCRIYDRSGRRGWVRRSQIRVQIRAYVVVSVEIRGGVKIEIRIEPKIRIYVQILVYWVGREGFP